MTLRIKKSGSVLAPTVLIILDGFGLADPKLPGNAITPKTAPHIFSYLKKYPNTKLKASGRDVGLFSGQEGNSEAGHFNIGAGRVVKQDVVRISEAIKDGTFFKNQAFADALHQTQAHHATVHVLGLLTNNQSAHAHPEHLYALLDYFRQQNFHNVVLHVFTDGRDSSPHSAITHLKRLRKYLKNNERIGTVMGRFYAMDRNKLWERTEMAYNAIVCGQAAHTAASAEEAITHAYNRGETDEYITPTVITEKNKPLAVVKDHDSVYFFNARSDRARQITKAFVQPDFNKKNSGAFRRRNFFKNISFVAMTDFGPDLPGIFTAFPSPDIKNCLAQAIGGECRQLYISETEKYAHVTYFLNGGYAAPINGETRELVASGDTYSYADKPAMRSAEVTRRILSHLKSKKYDFLTVNFPNVDMVGHTGDFFATSRAVQVVDQHVSEIVTAVLKLRGRVIITADHGNGEMMYNAQTAEIKTEHTTNSVPFIIVSQETKKIKLRSGRLADVAPTVLHLLGITKPKEMTGNSLKI